MHKKSFWKALAAALVAGAKSSSYCQVASQEAVVARRDRKSLGQRWKRVTMALKLGKKQPQLALTPCCSKLPVTRIPSEESDATRDKGSSSTATWAASSSADARELTELCHGLDSRHAYAGMQPWALPRDGRKWYLLKKLRLCFASPPREQPNALHPAWQRTGNQATRCGVETTETLQLDPPLFCPSACQSELLDAKATNAPDNVIPRHSTITSAIRLHSISLRLHSCVGRLELLARAGPDLRPEGPVLPLDLRPGDQSAAVRGPPRLPVRRQLPGLPDMGPLPANYYEDR
ncbi:hypothetical protein ON010_g16786 [Phytophthora cinnamomi]|nr:hypothetical protein ON010_g16786 [Phytophthora cinnamomi]